MADEVSPPAAPENRKRNIWVYIGISVGALIVLGLFLPDGGGDSELCDTMTHAQIDEIMHGNDQVENSAWQVITTGLMASPGVFTHGDGEVANSPWKGVGIPVVTKGMRSTTTSTGLFTHVEYLRIDSDDDDLTGEVFVFASTDGLLQGATNATRLFFTWGQKAGNGTPIMEQARNAVDNAPTCMS
jgi:hypothetical protein